MGEYHYQGTSGAAPAATRPDGSDGQGVGHATGPPGEGVKRPKGINPLCSLYTTACERLSLVESFRGRASFTFHLDPPCTDAPRQADAKLASKPLNAKPAWKQA